MATRPKMHPYSDTLISTDIWFHVEECTDNLEKMYWTGVAMAHEQSHRMLSTKEIDEHCELIDKMYARFETERTERVSRYKRNW